MLTKSIILTIALFLLTDRSRGVDLQVNTLTTDFSVKCFGIIQPLLQDIAVKKEAIDKCKAKDSELLTLQSKCDEVHMKLIVADSVMKEKEELIVQQGALCDLYRNNSDTTEELLKVYRDQDAAKTAQLEQRADELNKQAEQLKSTAELLKSCQSESILKQTILEQLKEEVQTNQLIQEQCARNVSERSAQLEKHLAEANERKDQLESCKDQLMGNVGQVEKLQQELQWNKVNAEELKTNLIKTEGQVGQLNAELRKKSDQREALQQQLNSTDQLIEQMKSQVDSLQLELNQIRFQLLQFKRQNDKLLSTDCFWFGNSSDIETIRLPDSGSYEVLCDSRLAGLGWTIIQRRFDGSEDFYRNWRDYREGFGNLTGEFFLGLEKLHKLTQFHAYELYIHLESFNGSVYNARYSEIRIGSESEGYALNQLGTYSGNATDALYFARGRKFSTPDVDNDKDEADCAKQKHGAWWYDRCGLSNLNGQYSKEPTDSVQGIFWLHIESVSFKTVQMMVRPVFANYV